MAMVEIATAVVMQFTAKSNFKQVYFNMSQFLRTLKKRKEKRAEIFYSFV